MNPLELHSSSHEQPTVIHTLEHIVVVESLNDLRKASKPIQNTRRLLRAAEPRWNDPRRYVNGPDCLKVRVAKPSIDRALLFFDQLVRTAAAHGCSVEVSEKDTVIKVGDVPLSVFVVEKIARKEIERPDFSWKTYEYKPSNILTFRIDEWSKKQFQKQWTDGKTTLEEKIPNIVVGLLRAAEIMKQERARREEEDRQWKEETARWEAERAREARERRELEDLQKAASEWVQREQIRAYIEACEKELRDRSNGQLTDEAKAWLEWARNKIEVSSPVVAQVEGILKPDSETEDA